MPPPDPDVLSKLTKLLRLANSANENEGAVAFSMAVKLATRHQLDIQSIQLDAEPGTKPTYEEREMVDSIKMSTAQRYVSQLLSTFFSVVTIRLGNAKKMAFVGTSANVDIAVAFATFLTPQFKAAWRQARGDHPGKRGVFYMGVFETLDARLQEARDEELTDSDIDIPQFNLSVRSEVQKIKDSIAAPVAPSKKVIQNPEDIATAAAALAGAEAGEEMDIPTASARPAPEKKAIAGRLK